MILAAVCFLLYVFFLFGIPFVIDNITHHVVKAQNGTMPLNLCKEYMTFIMFMQFLFQAYRSIDVRSTTKFFYLIMPPSDGIQSSASASDSSHWHNMWKNATSPYLQAYQEHYLVIKCFIYLAKILNNNLHGKLPPLQLSLSNQTDVFEPPMPMWSQCLSKIFMHSQRCNIVYFVSLRVASINLAFSPHNMQFSFQPNDIKLDLDLFDPLQQPCCK